MTPIVQTEIVTPAVEGHKSRWGYHSCSWQTYKKLKFLNRAYEDATRRVHAYRRWANKMPHNRVAYPRLFDDKGRPCGRDKTTPIVLAAPWLHPVFSRVEEKEVRWHPVHGYLNTPEVIPVVAFDHVPILEASRVARRPFATAAEVPKLPIPEAKIDALYAAAKAWRDYDAPTNRRPLTGPQEL